jgi:hypothetical protein
MFGPDFLVVELCRDRAAIEKHTVVDARAYCDSRPAGESATLAAVCAGPDRGRRCPADLRTQRPSTVTMNVTRRWPHGAI